MIPAVISYCGKYRYWLERKGDPAKRPVVFIMLNPSTADAAVDDATIRRCRHFAHGAPFGVVNLFAYRATDLRELWRTDDPVGPFNDAWIKSALNSDRTIICAWGANASAAPRAQQIKAMLPEAYCLGTTKGGHPKHPLYLPNDSKLEMFV